ncbi:MAG: DUF5996 family protein [Gammaproteobacteria bacterium]|nr:DUF5996 family protein [Gammaproteobacteria bacterium]
MTTTFPTIPDSPAFTSTRDALHAYSRILGDWAAHCRTRRKHWWHGSVRLALHGLSSGVICHSVDFQLDLDVRDSQFRVQTANGSCLVQALHGQTPASLAEAARDFLGANGIAPEHMPAPREDAAHARTYVDFSPEHARTIGYVWRAVLTALERLRNELREETSPLQLWPHHFDISLLWLPGELIHGQDPDNEEYADKQMNFGFTLGDTGIGEPYFYITAHPLPDALQATPLPEGSYWNTSSFTGAALLYKTLLRQSDPQTYLLELWRIMVHAGRQHLLAGN